MKSQKAVTYMSSVFANRHGSITDNIEIQSFLAAARTNDKAQADQAEQRRPWLMDGVVV
jgi:hypothetical protein